MKLKNITGLLLLHGGGKDKVGQVLSLEKYVSSGIWATGLMLIYGPECAPNDTKPPHKNYFYMVIA
jgi:hypothetical protein